MRRGRAPALGPSFRKLWVASTASNLGDGVLLAAVPLLARSVTESPMGVAAVTVSATLPWLLFGLVAGVVVDRSDRRRLMIGVDLLRAVALTTAAIAVGTDHLTLPLLVGIVFVVGAGETVFDTAAQAVLPGIVAADELEAANGQLLGGQLAANSILGPPLGGLLLGVAAMAPLALDAATFVASSLILIQVTVRPVPRKRPPHPSVRRELAEGLRWLWRHPTVRALAIGAGVVNLAHTAALAVLVLLVRDELGASAVTYGAVLGASAIGGLVGTQVASRIVRRLGRRQSLLSSITAFAIGLAVTGTAPHPVVVAAGLAVFALGGEVWNVVAVSYRQARVPEHLLGRVMATYRFIAYGAMPLGAALGGALASAEVRAPYLGGAGLTVVLARAIARATATDVELQPHPGRASTR